jgi:uncharacterized membrane protein YeaQ/YmgE (transglycosylase-associated protein family)
MRFLGLLVLILVAGLLAQDILDSAIGAWVALGVIGVLVVLRLVGSFGGVDWPDLGGDA